LKEIRDLELHPRDFLKSTTPSHHKHGTKTKNITQLKVLYQKPIMGLPKGKKKRRGRSSLSMELNPSSQRERKISWP